MACTKTKRGIDLSKNLLSSSNSKHIDVRYQILRELAASGDSSVQYLRSEDQHTDIVTKAIGREFRKAPRFPFGQALGFNIFLVFLVVPIIGGRLYW